MVYVILPVHNTLEQTKKFVRCLKKQSYKKITLVLIDCGSTDGTWEWVTHNYASLYCLDKSADVYWGDALAVAQHFFQTMFKPKYDDYVFIANNDSEFNEYFIASGIQALSVAPIVVASAYDEENNKFDGGVEVDWKHLKFFLSTTPNTCSTRAMFMRLADFVTDAEISRYIPHHCSGYAITYKLWKKGWRIYEPKGLSVTTDLTTTGILNPKNLFELFSIRCPNNPYYKTIFILECCPKKYWAINILKAWGFVLKVILKR